MNLPYLLIIKLSEQKWCFQITFGDFFQQMVLYFVEQFILRYVWLARFIHLVLERADHSTSVKRFKSYAIHKQYLKYNRGKYPPFGQKTSKQTDKFAGGEVISFSVAVATTSEL